MMLTAMHLRHQTATNLTEVPGPNIACLPEAVAGREGLHDVVGVPVESLPMHSKNRCQS